MSGIEFKCWLAIWDAATNYLCELSLAGKRDTSEAIWLRRLWWSAQHNVIKGKVGVSA
jgi:hypothetical protein